MCVLLCCRWNVVGIQGSLMSYFTEPIYFSSIILGSLYHADHLSRAMYQRIADIEDLPQQFSLNRPLLSGQYPSSLHHAKEHTHYTNSCGTACKHIQTLQYFQHCF